MADHLDAPGLKPPNMDARVDIYDIYAFQKSEGNADKSVLVLNVNPVAPTYADSFASDAVYELKIDINGDAIADIAFCFIFSTKEADTRIQKATVKRAVGEQAKGNGDDGNEILFENVPVSFGEDAIVATSTNTASTEEETYRFFAGIRSDLFFFDLEGMKNGMQFTGTDTFLDKNVFSIVLEMPKSLRQQSHCRNLGPSPNPKR
jgi:uncharacterized protein DUF4331